MNNLLIILFTGCFCYTSASVFTESLLRDVDAIVQESLQAFNVPGAAISIVHHDSVLLSQGYGLRNLEEQLPVTEETVFPIASCTKAFTATLLGQLVDEGKVSWDDPVQQYIPEFYTVDDERTAQLTIRDLLAHRTGVARHDFLWFLQDASQISFLDAVKHFEAAYDLRERFQYNNFMYAVAGLVIERVTGQCWEDAVASRLLNPLGMQASTTSLNQLKASPNIAQPYAEVEGLLTRLSFRDIAALSPGGGLGSSARDMANWLKLQLRPDPILQAETLSEMRRIQMPLAGKSDKEDKFLGYGLGWFVGQYRDHQVIHHGGDIDGFASEVALIPELGLGVVILTNSSTDGRYFVDSVRNQLFDKFLGASETDWVRENLATRSKNQHHLNDALQAFQHNRQTVDERFLEAYEGCYTHPGFGSLEVRVDEGRLVAFYGRSTIPLYAKTDGQFTGYYRELLVYGINPGIEFAFFKDEMGRVSQVDVFFENHFSAKPTSFKRSLATPSDERGYSHSSSSKTERGVRIELATALFVARK